MRRQKKTIPYSYNLKQTTNRNEVLFLSIFFGFNCLFFFAGLFFFLNGGKNCVCPEVITVEPNKADVYEAVEDPEPEMESVFIEETVEITETAEPTPTMEPTITPFPTMISNSSSITTYTVEEGDSCWGIAQSFGVDVYDLIEANGMTESCNILIGDRLIIP